MSVNRETKSRPLTFELTQEKILGLKHYQRVKKLGSLSDVVRVALDRYDFERLDSSPAQQQQVSIRLPSGVKERIVRLSRRHGISLGEIVRTCLEALPSVKEMGEMQTKPKTRTTMPAKKPAKKAVKKAPAKKVAVKKAPAKKAAVKKAPAKKAAVKKVAKKVAKKAPAKKK